MNRTGPSQRRRNQNDSNVHRWGWGAAPSWHVPVPKQVLPQLVRNSSSTAITLHSSGKINMKTHSTQLRTSLHQRLRYSTTIPSLPSCYLLGLGYGTLNVLIQIIWKLKQWSVILHLCFRRDHMVICVMSEFSKDSNFKMPSVRNNTRSRVRFQS